MSSAVRSVRYIVTGRVQGVFFRASTAREAASLGLRGWAKNLPDGRVEVVAGGADSALEALAAWLWHGPPAARVVSVAMEEWTESVPGDFSIR